MSRRLRVGAVLMVLLAALWGAPAAGQETVEFRLKLAGGEVIYAGFTASAQVTLQIGDQRQSSTVQMEIPIPNLGGARLLIYNDLGIAFGITSDEMHAEAGRVYVMP